MNPSDVDLSKKLQGYFGCVEFEDAICWIVRFLADDTRYANIPASLYGHGPAGWGKKIRLETIPNIDPTMFAMLCAAGWLQNCWFPKGAFTVTDAFIKRLSRMKLTELRPKWAVDADIVVGGQTVHDPNRTGMAISFDCPCCLGTPKATRLCVYFKNPIDGGLPSDDGKLWERSGETFENLTLAPSVDVSEHEHWHGHIKNGNAE